MDLALAILTDALRDTLALVPFLFVTYLALEALEHAAGSRVNSWVRRAGAAGPVVGALLGAVPQCGFSAMGATLYAGRVVTLGTLVAVFLSTSDELLPVFVASQASPALLGSIIVAKVAIALVTGVAVDLVVRALHHRHDLPADLAEAGEGTGHIHELCERDRCGCEDEELLGRDQAHCHGGHGHACVHGGHVGSPARVIVRSAVLHTVQVTAFIFLVTVVLVALLETVGEGALASLLASNEVLAVFASALVGLVPNCAASVVIAELYLEGVLALGPMMAGSLVSAGVGFLVLFRTNRGVRQSLVILALLYAVAVLWGLAIVALGF